MRLTRLLTTLFLTLVAVSASATTVKPMSLQELTQSSSNVVRARAINAHSQWNPQHTLIYTYTLFQVIESMKGQVPSEFVVRQLGGSAGGYTQKVSGVRSWVSGQEVVLFLRHLDQSDSFAVTGLFQGNFSLDRNANGELAVSNGVAGVSAFQQGAVKTYHGQQITLRQLQRVVRSVGGERR